MRISSFDEQETPGHGERVRCPPNAQQLHTESMQSNGVLCSCFFPQARLAFKVSVMVQVLQRHQNPGIERLQTPPEALKPLIYT